MGRHHLCGKPMEYMCQTDLSYLLFISSHGLGKTSFFRWCLWLNGFAFGCWIMHYGHLPPLSL